MSYFFHGSAYPREPHVIKQYGLYNSVIDRFVLTHHDPRILNGVRKLFSSRYHLLLCSLHTAENFSHGLIDNLICYNWSMRSSSNLRVTRFPQFDVDPISCEHLIELGSIDQQEQIWKDREYFWMAAQYVWYFVDHIWELGQYHPFINEELPIYASDEFRSTDQVNLPVELRNKIYAVFYRTFDSTVAEAQIKLILEDAKKHYWGTDGLKLDLSIDKISSC